MIVLDASVVVELLTNGPAADQLWRELIQQGDSILVPHLLDVEVISAIRRLDVAGRLDSHSSRQVLRVLADLPAVRCPHTPFLGRVWELRHNFTAYDAIYIALAEMTGAPLYTCDRKLSRGHRAEVRLFTC